MADQPGNQTPDTPDVSETELRGRKVDDLRDEARRVGVEGASSLHKEELVHAIARARQAAADGGSGGGSSGGSHRGGSGSGRRSSGEEPGNQTPDTPEVSETELRGRKVDDLRDEARRLGVEGASSLHKEELVQAIVAARTSGGGRSADGGDEPGDLGAGPDGGHVRTGPETSKSIKYSQEITSTDEEPERKGRSLVTTHHEVIREWAEARGGRPATVDGTEHGDHLGVLRFDFQAPTKGLREVSWDEWFETFDQRRLNFVYQEERTDGHRSTFFILESPDREDG
ncbi:Rho termination factor N-terminal domain-containing protein [Amnibacterium sp. CER49]|uniref:Rho termination factor N-terminal domain-containing protein n=1 Tax=Amnibacterium sp. CER49 TaxID=3039161 RepID=UPI002447113B|nr:Rho termination factor N-terminal domain-containing protein [Amnibacterium sp. CER49]MDH2442485.1 Rho termination factor N-terminal domain-containing protein [Amnibacterium sp. CER49]